jgi:hypothetical protein
VQLHDELATVKKGDLSTTDYFHKVKNLASELATADAALRDEDVLAYLLVGLPSDYDPFVTSITTKDSVSLDDVYAHLVTFEARQLQYHADLQLHMGSSANNVGRGGSPRAMVAVAPLGVEVRGLMGVLCHVPTTVACLALLHVLSARFAARKVTRPYAADTAWTNPTPRNLLPHMLPPHPRRFIPTGTPTPAPPTTSPAIWIVLPCVNATMAMNKSTSAMDQVCELCILAIPLLILPIILLRYIISFMFPTLLKTLFQCINFQGIMAYFLNIILVIFSIKDQHSRKSLLDGQCESGLYPIKLTNIPTLKHALAARSTTYSHWHARLGHPAPQVV